MPENPPLIPSGKIKKASASELAEWVSEAWKKISNKNKTMSPSSRNRALDGTEGDTVLNNTDVTDSEVNSDSEGRPGMQRHFGLP